ncbi:hypothetical protein ACLOJK_020913 [Asimina triloba]
MKAIRSHPLKSLRQHFLQVFSGQILRPLASAFSSSSAAACRLIQSDSPSACFCYLVIDSLVGFSVLLLLPSRRRRRLVVFSGQILWLSSPHNKCMRIFLGVSHLEKRIPGALFYSAFLRTYHFLSPFSSLRVVSRKDQLHEDSSLHREAAGNLEELE